MVATPEACPAGRLRMRAKLWLAVCLTMGCGGASGTPPPADPASAEAKAKADMADAKAKAEAAENKVEAQASAATKPAEAKPAPESDEMSITTRSPDALAAYKRARDF